MIEQYGLGALPSPDDDRDFPIEELYAVTGAVAAALPTSYRAPDPMPPVLNQHTTPMCVAYSSSSLKAYEDLRDQGLVDFDEPRFFGYIGGTANGAVPRVALDRMLNVGYPVVVTGDDAKHKITAYYRVPVDRDSICQAIKAFGPVLISASWVNSWFHPNSAGVLPAPSGGSAGGHLTLAIGWDTRGLRFRNSWGTGWGLSGEAIIPWAYLGRIVETWKAVDARTRPASLWGSDVPDDFQAIDPPASRTARKLRALKVDWKSAINLGDIKAGMRASKYSIGKTFGHVDLDRWLRGLSH